MACLKVLLQQIIDVLHDRVVVVCSSTAALDLIQASLPACLVCPSNNGRLSSSKSYEYNSVDS